MTRGLVVATTVEETILFCRKMANHPGAHWFDPGLPIAPEGYYRLKYPNGGTNPSASDNFAHWVKGSDGDPHIVDATYEGFHFITGDCVSLVARAKRFDRFQPVRGKHIQGGSINCDFMRADVGGPAKCFTRLDRPQPGCIVVYGSLPDQDHDGERDGAGHTGIVVSVPAEWDPTVKESWLALGVIDCASRTPHFAVQLTNGRAWFGSRVGKAGIVVPKDSWFLESIMT